MRASKLPIKPGTFSIQLDLSSRFVHPVSHFTGPCPSPLDPWSIASVFLNVEIKLWVIVVWLILAYFFWFQVNRSHNLDELPMGTTKVLFTAFDSSGNSNSCTLNYTLISMVSLWTFINLLYSCKFNTHGDLKEIICLISVGTDRSSLFLIIFC